MRRRTDHVLSILIAAGVGFGGCGPAQQVQSNPAYIPDPATIGYDDHAWETVLRENVRDGLVDYRRLAEHREPLDRYLGLVSVVGPESTPNLFPTPSDQICYYINVHNACMLAVVLQSYPTTTIHRLETRPEYGIRFRVDRRNVTLAQLREKLEGISQGDVRIHCCLCEASLGSPLLSDTAFKPNSLREQARQAAQQALENPNILRIDYENRRLYLWGRILSNQEEFSAFADREIAPGSGLITLLAQCASPPVRDGLQKTNGFEIRRVPVNRLLNDVDAAVAPASAQQAPR